MQQNEKILNNKNLKFEKEVNDLNEKLVKFQ